MPDSPTHETVDENDAVHEPAQMVAHDPADGETHAEGGEEHAEEHGGEHAEHPPELTNLFQLAAKSGLNNKDTHPFLHKVIRPFDEFVDDPIQANLHRTNQNLAVILVSVVLIIVVMRYCMRKMALIPNRAQSACEMLIEGLYNFFITILGEKHGPRYIPFLLALFVFIWVSNMMGMVPFMKSPSAFFQTNIVYGLCVFLYVQYTGMRYLGPKHYLLHLMGNPQGVVMWIMAPLMFMLEIISELIKPLSLSLRLFGNVLGEDILLGVFAMLGLLITGAIVGVENPIIGIPLHLPFMFLALLLGTIQALIFSLLACVYISLMLPHEGESH